MSESFIILNFAEARQPEYKEKKGQGYMEFGEMNDYPNYLLDLYNKSAKHNAIINGKTNYIYGGGLITDDKTSSVTQKAVTNKFINKLKPFINDMIKDFE